MRSWKGALRMGGVFLLGLLLAGGASAETRSSSKLIVPKVALQKTNDQTMTGGKANFPPAENIPGTGAHIAKRLDEISKQIDLLSQHLSRQEKQQAALRNEFLAFQKEAQRPVCSEGLQSMHPGTGARENCSPYGCNAVSGLCRTTCSVTAHCGPKFYCDNGRCVPGR